MYMYEKNNKDLNIFLLTHARDPNNPLRPGVLEICKFFPKKGHSVHLVFTQEGETDPDLKYLPKDLDVIEVGRENNFIIKKINDKILNSFKKGFILYKMVRDSRELNKKNIILVRNSVVDALLALTVRILYRSEIVFQYSFPIHQYANDYTEKPFNFKNFILGQYFRLKSLLLLLLMKRFDLVLPIGDTMLKELENMGFNREKMHIVSTGVNEKFFNPTLKDLEKPDVKSKIPKDKLLLGYIGSLGQERNLESVIDAVGSQIQNKSKVDCILIIIGTGSSENKLRERVKKLGAEKYVKFLGRTSYENIPNYVSLFDLCLSIVSPIPSHISSRPAKLLEYMAMKKPVIANSEIPFQKKVIEESGGGVLIKNNKPEELINAIIFLAENPSERKRMGYKNRKYVLSRYSYNKILGSLESVL